MDVQTSKTGHKTKVVYSAIGSLTAGILFSLYMFNVYRKEIEAFRTVPMVGSHHPLILVVATALYLLAIYWFIPNYMKNREPAKMTWLKTAHNYFLVVFSFIIVYEAVPAMISIARNASRPGLFWTYEALFCDQADVHASNGTLYFLLHIFYLSKYYEMLDTVFICLSKKQPIFLHVYHHVVTLLTIWVGIWHHFAGQFVLMTANAFVHVFMYYYYLLQTWGVSVWWKRYLTSMQIVQFVMDEFAIVSWPYFVVVVGIPCAARWSSFALAFTVVTSFLVLFGQFYVKTYKSPNARAKAQ